MERLDLFLKDNRKSITIVYLLLCCLLAYIVENSDRHFNSEPEYGLELTQEGCITKISLTENGVKTNTFVKVDTCLNDSSLFVNDNDFYINVSTGDYLIDSENNAFYVDSLGFSDFVPSVKVSSAFEYLDVDSVWIELNY